MSKEKCRTWNLNKPLGSFPMSFHMSLATIAKGDETNHWFFLAEKEEVSSIKQLRKKYSLFLAIVRIHGTPEQRETLAHTIRRTEAIGTSTGWQLHVKVWRRGFLDFVETNPKVLSETA